MNFIFIFFLIGVIFAVYQDLTRREIDDWLNLFLFFSGILFLGIFNGLFSDFNLLVSFGFFVFSVSLLSFAFYYGRFFSGGDSKLLFALSPFFFNPSIESSFIHLFYFILLLFVCGSAYSLVYAMVLFVKDFKKVKVFMFKEFKKKSSLFIFIFGIIFLFLGLFKNIFLIFGILVFFFLFLLSLAKSLTEVSMKKLVNTKNLREGDWLFEDVKIGKKIFRKDLDGLSSEDLSYLKKFNKNIFIKDGIPYAPSFLIALIFFEYSSYLLGTIFS